MFGIWHKKLLLKEDNVLVSLHHSVKYSEEKHIYLCSNCFTALSEAEVALEKTNTMQVWYNMLTINKEQLVQSCLLTWASRHSSFFHKIHYYLIQKQLPSTISII